MSCNTLVDEFRHKELNRNAQDFANHYVPSLSSVVLLPGGMGSSHLQNQMTYPPGQPFPRDASFAQVWLSFLRLIQGDVAELEMPPFGEDKAFKPIIASSELSSLLKKYEGIGELFNDRANYIGFGYDSRRSQDKEFMYLRAFLKQIQSRVKKEGHKDPLPNFTLYAHSQDGLVAKFLSMMLLRGGRYP